MQVSLLHCFQVLASSVQMFGCHQYLGSCVVQIQLCSIINQLLNIDSEVGERMKRLIAFNTI